MSPLNFAKKELKEEQIIQRLITVIRLAENFTFLP